MAYATQADLKVFIPPGKLAQLTSVDDDETADSAVVTLALAGASSLIDGYLAGRYVVPVTDATTLAILKPHCIVLVKWALFLRNDIGEAFDSSLKAEYQTTIDWLMAVGGGKLTLPSGAAVPTVDVTIDEDEATIDSEDPVFDATNAGAL